MAEIDPIVVKLDQLINMSRLRELALILNTDRVDRLARILAALSRLKTGAYLLGTGPSTGGIIPLTVDEVVLGRTATPGEEPSQAVIDYAVTDTLYFGPWETSRLHAKITRVDDTSDMEYRVLDLESSCGTYVNGEPVDKQGRSLSHGDVLSLGPSQVSTYLFFVASHHTSDRDSEAKRDKG
jgi:pSer/pThr/pTyr-binding forkhead associated (FHA) protein